MLKFVIDIFCVIVEIFLVRYLFQAFLGECKLNKRNEIAMYIIAGCVDMIYSTVPISSTVKLCCSFLNFAIVAQFYSVSFLLKIFYVALNYGLKLCCEFFANTILAVLYNELPLDTYAPGLRIYVHGVFLAKSMAAGIIFFIASFKRQNEYYGKQSLLCIYVALLILMVVCSCQLGYAVELVQTAESYIRYLFITCAIVITIIVVFFLFSRQMRMEQMHWQLKMAELRESMQQDYYSALIERDIEVSSIKHDMQNHLQFLKYKAESNDVETVKNYINSLIEILLQNKMHYTNQKTINTILNIKAKAAREKEITLDVSVPKEIDNLEISDMDLVVLLANCLDNAIEAVERMTDNKTIRLVIYDQEDGISIYVENSYLQIEKNKLFVTSKANKQEHGYGLQNIRRTVEKYSGIFRIESEEQKFKVKIFLPK